MPTVSEYTIDSGPEQNAPRLSPPEDLTGRDQMVRNVLASWIGHLIFVVAGFIMPRLIDWHIGQSALGVWDFSWSLVNYFSLTQIGIGSSVNRYVARYRAAHDVEGLNCAVSSVMCIQFLAGLLVVVMTLLATGLLPVLFGDRLADHCQEARWVVALLGGVMAIQMFLNVYVGVVVGCHRWDLHNGINAGFHALTVLAMITGLSLGGGLRSLALANFVGTGLTELARVCVAHRVCPELRIRPTYARWSQVLEMLTFGGKSVLNSISRLLLYQTNSMLIVAYLGPASLALFSRPQGLVMQAQTLVSKFGFVLAPMASSLQASDRREDLGRLLIQTGRYATCLALPMVLILAIMGDPLLKLWMGTRYEQGFVLAVLAVGHLTEMTRQPVISILAGMNAHGRLGFINLAAAILSVLLAFVALGVMDWGLLGAAIALVIPLVLVNGTFVPFYACRELGLPVRRFLAESSRMPFLLCVPFAACLLGARMWLNDQPLLSLTAGVASGGLVLTPLYWRYVLPERIRGPIVTRVRRFFQLG